VSVRDQHSEVLRRCRLALRDEGQLGLLLRVRLASKGRPYNPTNHKMSLPYPS